MFELAFIYVCNNHRIAYNIGIFILKNIEYERKKRNLKHAWKILSMLCNYYLLLQNLTTQLKTSMLFKFHAQHQLLQLVS